MVKKTKSFAIVFKQKALVGLLVYWPASDGISVYLSCKIV